MADWLESLREEKRRASVQAVNNELASDSQNQLQERLAQLQARLVELNRQLQIEPLLLEFMAEVIRDHPLYPNSTLSRLVTSRSPNSLFEYREPAPWSASLEHNELPTHLQLESGRSIIRLEWRMHLNALTPDRKPKPFDIVVTATERGVEVNGQALAPLTSDNFKRAVLYAFQNPVPMAGSENHVLAFTPLVPIPLPWYMRVWQRLFQSDNPARNYFFYALTMIIVAATIGALVVAIASSANARGRRRPLDPLQPLNSAPSHSRVLTAWLSYPVQASIFEPILFSPPNSSLLS